MKFFFENPDMTQVMKSFLKSSLSGRKLGQMVSIQPDGELIKVTISKLGTSTIHFARKARDGGQEWCLDSEKIALSHRAFKSDVMEKL